MKPDFASMTPKAVRALCRIGAFTAPTAGVAHGRVQANMMIVPQYVAERSRIPFCITHSPGKMFVTDLVNA